MRFWKKNAKIKNPKKIILNRGYKSFLCLNIKILRSNPDLNSSKNSFIIFLATKKNKFYVNFFLNFARKNVPEFFEKIFFTSVVVSTFKVQNRQKKTSS